jgi:hypothetical protein
MKIAMGLLWLTACALAQGTLESARLGTMLDSAGAARFVHGIAGSVTLSDPALNDVVAFGCARDRCLYKTADRITDGHQSSAAPAGGAIIASNFVYFVDAQQFALWRDGALSPIALELNETVIALRRATAGVLDIAVRRDSGVTVLRVRLADGASETIAQYPDATGPALLLPDAILFADSATVILRRADGTEQRYALSGAQAFFAANDELVQIRTAEANFALRVTPGCETLFQLPESRP